VQQQPTPPTSGHDRGHRVLTVTRKGGRRATVVLPLATAAALDAYLMDVD